MKVKFIIESDLLGEIYSYIEWNYPVLPEIGHLIHNPLAVLDQASIDNLKSKKVKESKVLTEIYPKSFYDKTIFDLLQNMKIDNNWKINCICWDMDAENLTPSIFIKDSNILDRKIKDKIFNSHSSQEQQEINWTILNRIATEEYEKVIERFNQKYGNIALLWEKEETISMLAESFLNTDYIKISYWHGTDGSGWCFDELVQNSNQHKSEWIANGNIFAKTADIEHLSKIKHRIELKKTNFNLKRFS